MDSPEFHGRNSNAPAIGAADLSHLRLTLDDEEDYQRIVRLFEGVADPVSIGWLELAKKLAILPGEPRYRVPYRISANKIHSELTLGTAQLGMEYGIVNRAGQPALPLAIAIVRGAIAHGVTALDTARSYGTAENVLGAALAGAWRSRVQVVTKLDPLATLAHDAAAAEVRAAVDDSVRRSREALQAGKLSTLLLHRSSHHHDWGGAVWRRLLELREEGMIDTLGASVYEPGEALELLQDPAIAHLQIPMNVLDWRWRASGTSQTLGQTLARALADRPDVVVHARSALLQGLLVSPAAAWPLSPGFDVEARLRQFRQAVGQI